MENLVRLLGQQRLILFHEMKIFLIALFLMLGNSLYGVIFLSLLYLHAHSYAVSVCLPIFVFIKSLWWISEIAGMEPSTDQSLILIFHSGIRSLRIWKQTLPVKTAEVSSIPYFFNFSLMIFKFICRETSNWSIFSNLFNDVQ